METIGRLLLLFVLGMTFGSFLSVLIYRLYNRKKGVWLGRSECPHCHQTLKWVDLIPLLSYLTQSGRCRYCGKSIGWYYPLLELAGGFLFVGMGVAGFTPLPLYLFYGLVLLFIFFYDLLYLEVPDEVMLPSIAVAVLASLFPQTLDFKDALVGATAVAGFFLIQIILSKGKWLGGGDLRIGAFMGFILGLKLAVVATFLAYLIGAVVSLFLLMMGRVSRKSMIAFGPFLVFGTLISLFYGDNLVEWYLNLIYL